jgi:hypothetical protein
MLILILIFWQPSLVWLRITSHHCYNAWRLLWFDHGSSPHLRKTTQNYGKGGAGIDGLRRLECMTARELAIQGGRGLTFGHWKVEGESLEE